MSANLTSWPAQPRSAGVPVGARLLFGEPALEIIRQVLGERHDLVIKPAEEHHGVTDAPFGNTDMELMRRCPCPVWVLKNGSQSQSRASSPRSIPITRRRRVAGSTR